MNIRPAKIEDVDPIAGVLVAAWQNGYAGIVNADYPATMSREKYSKIFTGIIEESLQTVYVFQRNNSVSGFVSGRMKEGKYDCQIVGLYVSPEEQGNSIGSILLDKMIKHFKSNDCKKMIVWTLLGAKNNSFYRKHLGAEKEYKEITIGSETYPGVGFVFDLHLLGCESLGCAVY
ncbi:MAG: GNAT family N-acetyltransferase [Candidatus Fermentibacteria bacterium]|nr:GNAT family N-acetyltransferase [Candidatus Fermentibacteria bacterium]